MATYSVGMRRLEGECFLAVRTCASSILRQDWGTYNVTRRRRNAHTRAGIVLCDVCSTGIEDIQSCKCSNMTISVTIIFFGFHYDIYFEGTQSTLSVHHRVM